MLEEKFYREDYYLRFITQDLHSWKLSQRRDY